jgi:hypothetical protein
MEAIGDSERVAVLSSAAVDEEGPREVRIGLKLSGFSDEAAVEGGRDERREDEIRQARSTPPDVIPPGPRSSRRSSGGGGSLTRRRTLPGRRIRSWLG